MPIKNKNIHKINTTKHQTNCIHKRNIHQLKIERNKSTYLDRTGIAGTPNASSTEDKKT